MSLASETSVPIRHADRFFIGGQWVTPSSEATIKVIDSGTEEVFFTVAEAQAADISRAVAAAREAFDTGPWPRLSHAERAGYLRAIGEEIARCTLELGGKSAAVILDDMDLETAAATLSQAECFLSGQVCSSLTRIVVPRSRHDELVEALASTFSQVRVGDPFEDQTHAIRVANDTIYGLNASVFTNDVNRAREVAGQLRSGTVGHNAFRTDFGIAFGGFKQSGIGREGGREGLLPFLETKTVILEGRPAGYEDTEL